VIDVRQTRPEGGGGRDKLVESAAEKLWASRRSHDRLQPSISDFTLSFLEGLMAGLRFLDVTQDRKDISWKWLGSDMLVAISLLTAAHWAIRGLSANDVRHRSRLDQLYN
jgi:hypothetical protein